MALDFYDLVLSAVMELERQDERLDEADRMLTQIRLYLHCISLGQLEHATQRTDEIGRLLGGWKRRQGGS